MNYIYTGIGSRSTPKETLQLFALLGRYFAQKGFILRSGGAKGADTAFENGCKEVNGRKEIYIPWKGFEDSRSSLVVESPMAFQIAKKFHPNWESLSEGAKKLQARNSHQILGWDLESPSNFVVCYTEGGKRKGGTGQALRLAESLNIPIFDFGLGEEVKKDLRLWLEDSTSRK